MSCHSPSSWSRLLSLPNTTMSARETRKGFLNRAIQTKPNAMRTKRASPRRSGTCAGTISSLTRTAPWTRRRTKSQNNTPATVRPNRSNSSSRASSFSVNSRYVMAQKVRAAAAGTRIERSPQDQGYDARPKQNWNCTQHTSRQERTGIPRSSSALTPLSLGKLREWSSQELLLVERKNGSGQTTGSACENAAQPEG